MRRRISSYDNTTGVAPSGRPCCDQFWLRADLQTGIIDIHRCDVSEPIVIDTELYPYSRSPEAIQVELVVRPGLDIAALPEQRVDPVAIPV